VDWQPMYELVVRAVPAWYGYVAEVLIHAWQQNSGPVVVGWSGPLEDRLECCYSSPVYWWQMRAPTASWLLERLQNDLYSVKLDIQPYPFTFSDTRVPVFFSYIQIKLKPGLVTSYDLRPGNEAALFLST